MLLVERVNLVDSSLPGLIKAFFFHLRFDDDQELLGQIVRFRSGADVGSVISE